MSWSALVDALCYGAVAASLWGSLMFVARANMPKQGVVFGLMMIGHGLAALGLSVAAIFYLGVAVVSALSK